MVGEGGDRRRRHAAVACGRLRPPLVTGGTRKVVVETVTRLSVIGTRGGGRRFG